MKLRECRSCLPSEMKFSASNYSIHWFKNSIVASLARFRPEIVIKGAGANASNLFRRTLVSSTVRIFVRRRWSVNVPRPFSRAVHERVHRGKACGGERLWRTRAWDKKFSSVVKQLTKKCSVSTFRLDEFLCSKFSNENSSCTSNFWDCEMENVR